MMFPLACRVKTLDDQYIIVFGVDFLIVIYIVGDQ